MARNKAGDLRYMRAPFVSLVFALAPNGDDEQMVVGVGQTLNGLVERMLHYHLCECEPRGLRARVMGLLEAAIAEDDAALQHHIFVPFKAGGDEGVEFTLQLGLPD